MTNWAKEKLKYLQWAYGEFYEYAVEMNQDDDRWLFINIFENIKEAIEAVGEVDNNLVRVALNKEIRENQEVLSKIQNAFNDKFQANAA